MTRIVIKLIITTVLSLIISHTVCAGMDFSMLGESKVQKYVQEITDFRERSIDTLKNIIQLVYNTRAVHGYIYAMQQELNHLAVLAGETQEDGIIEMQTRLEDVMTDNLKVMLDKYEAGDKTYFDTVAETIRELKKFEVPKPVGADVYFGCEVISRRKVGG